MLRVGELDDPAPGPGEVLVRLHASGVNPADVKLRSGWLKVHDALPRIIPNCDGAGVIEALGAGVAASRLGERVWVHTAKESPNGTAAQYIALDQALVQPLPGAMSFAEGACVGVPIVTAHHAVLIDGSLEGQTILIAGGAGAVGHYAVQLAKQAGATVIATVSSAEKANHARGAGADHIINYREEDVAARVLALTGGAGVERIVEVDFGANVAIDAEVIKPGGVIASYSSTSQPEPVLPYYPLALKGVTLRLVQAHLVSAEQRRAMLADIGRRLVAGGLEHAIGRRFALDQIALAHEAVESGAVIGNVVVDIG
ncbi:MAG: NADPH:quinone reductase [Kiloniellales bacterium]|nr:NADPH:quinone reductase [Kiloniellales bacterium]